MSGETLDSKLRKHAESLMMSDHPLAQEDLCQSVAEVCATHIARPNGDKEFRTAGEGMASGLFGDEYQEADDDQKRMWNAMCERALRSEWAKRSMLN